MKHYTTKKHNQVGRDMIRWKTRT